MNTTPTDLTVESIEHVLQEKEAALAKEQAMLEGLKTLLGRMGYDLVPAGAGKRQGSGRGRPVGTPSSPSAGAAPEGRKRGRPRKLVAVAAPSGEISAE